jgi:hypothetical protein
MAAAHAPGAPGFEERGLHVDQIRHGSKGCSQTRQKAEDL